MINYTESIDSCRARTLEDLQTTVFGSIEDDELFKKEKEHVEEGSPLMDCDLDVTDGLHQ